MRDVVTSWHACRHACAADTLTRCSSRMTHAKGKGFLVGRAVEPARDEEASGDMYLAVGKAIAPWRAVGDGVSLFFARMVHGMVSGAAFMGISNVSARRRGIDAITGAGL